VATHNVGILGGTSRGVDMDKILVRVSEAARLADVSRTTAYKLIATGQWPHIRIMGSAIRVPVAGLREWIEGEVRRATAQTVGERGDTVE